MLSFVTTRTTKKAKLQQEQGQQLCNIESDASK